MPHSILFIAPDDGFRSKVAGRLSEKGLIVNTEADPDEAVRTLADKGARVVLLVATDSSEKDLSLLQRIIATARNAKVILLEHGGDVDFIMEAKKLGAFDDILIPFELKELMGKIEAAMAAPSNRGHA